MDDPLLISGLLGLYFKEKVVALDFNSNFQFQGIFHGLEVPLRPSVKKMDRTVLVGIKSRALSWIVKHSQFSHIEEERGVFAMQAFTQREFVLDVYGILVYEYCEYCGEPECDRV